MGSKGGGQTSTVTHNSPPQLLNEGREGYEQASAFYKNILNQPPIYDGPRVADMAPAQREALDQGRSYFGTPQSYQIGAERMVDDTLNGRYSFQDPISPQRDDTLGRGYGLGRDNYGLTGSGFSAPGVGGSSANPYKAQINAAKSTYNVDPRYDYKSMTDDEIKTAADALSEPMLANLEENVMPQIRDSSQLAGQGATSRRGDIERTKAVAEYGRTVGKSVLGPLMMQREQLDQDYDKAVQSYLQATAEGDANRATAASTEMARISGQSHDVANRINADRGIAEGELSLRAQEGASRERIAGAGLQSQERLGEAGLTSSERRDAASLYSNERNRYGDRALAAHEGERGRQMDAVGRSSQLLRDEQSRIMTLYQMGAIDQAHAQRLIDDAKAQFEEPLYRQSQAAGALAGMAGLGPGSSQSQVSQAGESDAFGDVMQGVQMAMMVGSIAAKAGA